jgi:hypothetical protein
MSLCAKENAIGIAPFGFFEQEMLGIGDFDGSCRRETSLAQSGRGSLGPPVGSDDRIGITTGIITPGDLIRHRHGKMGIDGGHNMKLRLVAPLALQHDLSGRI